jgi:hypothetical protein
MDVLENLFPLVLVALFIFRIIVSLRRSGKKARTGAAENPNREDAPVKAKLEQSGADFIPHWLEPEEPVQKKKAPKKPRPLPLVEFPAGPLEAAPPAAALLPSAAPPRPVRKAVPQAKTKAGFPENLGHLPPLKQAVILGDILGPPKAMSADRGFP